MNNRVVDSFISELQSLKENGCTINSKDVRGVIDKVKNIFGIFSDELAVVSKAADRIFKTDERE